MTERATLYQQVIDQPNEDAPRYAFADWLAKEGDAERAEFIRLQCRLAANDFGTEEREIYRKREHELLSKYAWEWAEEFGADIAAWKFERGFVSHVQMSLEARAEEILDVCQRGPVANVRDTGQFCELEGFVEALPHLGHLRGVEFWCLYDVDDALVAKLLQSPHLQQLRTLILHHDRNGNMVDERVLVDGLQSPHRRHLEHLAVNVDCSWRGPTNSVIEAIAAAEFLSNLRILDLSNAGDPGNNPQLSLDAVRRLGASANIANLEVLDLRSLHAPAAVWEAILDFPCLSQLKKLYMCQSCEVSTGKWHPIVGDIDEIDHWREAFEQLEVEIDWQTRFIDPYSEHAYNWRGYSWAGQRQAVLFAMADYIARRDFDALERDYRQLCDGALGESTTRKVEGVDVKQWCGKVRAALLDALSVAEQRDSPAVVIRVRPDLEWSTKVGIHDEYFGSELNDGFMAYEEYAYDGPEHTEDAGISRPIARFLKREPLNRGTKPNYAALYLIARCLADVGRLLDTVQPRPRMYCSLMWAAFRFR